MRMRESLRGVAIASSRRACTPATSRSRDSVLAPFGLASTAGDATTFGTTIVNRTMTSCIAQ
jgi:hypothetical protein